VRPAKSDLHALDVLIDAALAEFVQATPCRLGFEVNARANLAQQRIILDYLE
jgi:hypothetical protein